MDIAPGEKLSAVIALGYGATQGVAHKGKSYTDVTSVPFEQAPQWFRDRGKTPEGDIQIGLHILRQGEGTDAAGIVADHAVGLIEAQHFGLGVEFILEFAVIDLGIARRFFEIGAAPQVVCWE